MLKKMKLKNHFEYKIIDKHDFDYVSVFFSLPEILIAKNDFDVCDMLDSKNQKIMIKFSNELVYRSSSYEDGETYFRIFWIKVFGFGVGFKKQTGY